MRSAWPLVLATVSGTAPLTELDARRADVRAQQCLQTAFPQSRTDFPALLNCLGLTRRAVEVGVQAGVHASGFLQGWDGAHLRLVDKWDGDVPEAQDPTAQSPSFYIDIANIDGIEMRKRHRGHCEARLADAARSGRAEILNAESTVAAAQVPDGDLDFVYLDARHDFAGVVADIHAWWPKVKLGGIFAGHDFVDGEFPEGDFFWISALREVLPGLEEGTYVTKEKNRYPSFFIMKTEAMLHMKPQVLEANSLARKLYEDRSKYYPLWRNAAAFPEACLEMCGEDCAERVRNFTPSRTFSSTLRPFSCTENATESDQCGKELVVDVQAYNAVCGERCAVTCPQRGNLFAMFEQSVLAV